MVMEIIFFVGLILSGLLLFLVLSTPHDTKQNEQDKQLFSSTTKVRPLYNMKREFKMADNGGTRLGIDRRKFHYTAYIPERRSGIDRRKGFYRRTRMTRGKVYERKDSLNHRDHTP